MSETLTSLVLGVISWWLFCWVFMIIFTSVLAVSERSIAEVGAAVGASLLYYGPLLAVSFCWVGVPIFSILAFLVRKRHKAKRAAQEP